MVNVLSLLMAGSCWTDLHRRNSKRSDRVPLYVQCSTIFFLHFLFRHECQSGCQWTQWLFYIHRPVAVMKYFKWSGVYMNEILCSESASICNMIRTQCAVPEVGTEPLDQSAILESGLSLEICLLMVHFLTASLSVVLQEPVWRQ